MAGDQVACDLWPAAEAAEEAFPAAACNLPVAPGVLAEEAVTLLETLVADSQPQETAYVGAPWEAVVLEVAAMAVAAVGAPTGSEAMVERLSHSRAMAAAVCIHQVEQAARAAKAAKEAAACNHREAQAATAAMAAKEVVDCSRLAARAAMAAKAAKEAVACNRREAQAAMAAMAAKEVVDCSRLAARAGAAAPAVEELPVASDMKAQAARVEEPRLSNL